MKVNFRGVLIALLFLLLIVTNVIQCNEEERIYTNNIPYHTLDSFNRVISALEEYAIKQERIIDSLKANTNKTIIKYEKDIKNFSDIYIISDDSITRYIRQRIESL